MADEIELREALQGMVEQFAHRTHVKGSRAFSTGGLSALEQAFGVLGWNDPHVVGDADSVGCEIAGCHDWAECVGPYPRSRAKLGAPPSMIGFGYLCTNHYFTWSGTEAVAADDLGRKP